MNTESLVLSHFEGGFSGVTCQGNSMSSTTLVEREVMNRKAYRGEKFRNGGLLVSVHACLFIRTFVNV